MRDKNLDGERDKDLLRVRTAEVTSMWWAWVGEGKAKVPPEEFENDIVAVECWLSGFWVGRRRRERNAGAV